MLKAIFILYLIFVIIDTILKALDEGCLNIKVLMQDIIILMLIAINS